MKKLEKAKILINDFGKLQYGFDFDILKDFFQKKGFSVSDNFIKPVEYKIEYTVSLYFFVEGKNTFTIKIDDRKEFISRKKLIGARLIKINLPKKALKLFKTVIEYSSQGMFEEDKHIFKPDLLSGYLNSSLCFWKLENWSKMKEMAYLALKVDQKNVKAIYRIGLAEQKLMSFEDGLTFLNLYSDVISDEIGHLKASIAQDLKKANDFDRKIFKNMLN